MQFRDIRADDEGRRVFHWWREADEWKYKAGVLVDWSKTGARVQFPLGEPVTIAWRDLEWGARLVSNTRR